MLPFDAPTSPGEMTDPSPAPVALQSSELQRLAEDARREKNWKRWGPYLSERQWATIREDYSENGDCWTYFPHDHARSRAYRWGEDGLLGICDRECRIAFAIALWNGHDPILKERLFGLTGKEGNHGEDVKECYYYLDSTPTHSYMRMLYKYPQAAFPYADLAATNRGRGRDDPEYELLDTGVFDGGRYFDVFVEYAKASQDAIVMRVTAENRGPAAAPLHLLPTLWFRNTWSWGGRARKPALRRAGGAAGDVDIEHDELGRWTLRCGDAVVTGADPSPVPPMLLFTENETNHERLFGGANASPYVKDGIDA